MPRGWSSDALVLCTWCHGQSKSLSLHPPSTSDNMQIQWDSHRRYGGRRFPHPASCCGVSATISSAHDISKRRTTAAQVMTALAAVVNCARRKTNIPRFQSRRDVITDGAISLLKFFPGRPLPSGSQPCQLPTSLPHPCLGLGSENLPTLGWFDPSPFRLGTSRLGFWPRTTKVLREPGAKTLNHGISRNCCDRHLRRCPRRKLDAIFAKRTSKARLFTAHENRLYMTAARCMYNHTDNALRH